MSPPFAPEQTNGKILLVDDNEADVWLVQEAFQALHIATQLQIAHTGQEALVMLKEGELPVLILLDINLPGIDGFEVLQFVRSDPKLRATPVIILSSSSHLRDIQKAYELGANAYVCKPFDNFMDLVGDFERFWLRRAQLPTQEGTV